MARAALTIGINNYPGVDADLAGAVNDAHDWAAFLSRNGFNPLVLTDKKASKRRLVDALLHTLSQLSPGDTGVITFAGHGTWVPDFSGDEPDQRDEALVPADARDESGLLLDDELSLLLSGRTRNTSVVLVTDCCHSGTLFRLWGVAGQRRRYRFLPPQAVVRDPDRVALLPRVAAATPTRNRPLPGVVHFAACSDRELACDGEFDGRRNGALTHHLLRALDALPRGTYADLLDHVRLYLPSWDCPQRPRLNAPTALRRQRAFA